MRPAALRLLLPAILRSAAFVGTGLFTAFDHLILGGLSQGGELLGELDGCLFELLLLFLIEIVVLVFLTITGRVFLPAWCVTVNIIIIVF